MLYWQLPLQSAKDPNSKISLMTRSLRGGSSTKVLDFPYSSRSQISISCPNNAQSQCVFSDAEDHTITFYSLDFSQHRYKAISKAQLDTDGIFGWQVSPSGSKIALVDQSNENAIRILDLSNQSWHKHPVEPGWALYQAVAWGADEKSFFVTVLRPEFSLLQIGLTGKVRLLRTSNQWMSTPLPSPDGHKLAFVSRTWDSNVWLL